MRIIGVTGPSGAGKGAVSAVLKSENIKIIDADAVYHSVIAPPSECLDELVDFFGGDILSVSGELDRPSLSKKVFGEENKDNLLILNRITHKYVSKRIDELLKEYRVENIIACVIDAPLLIEAGLDKICDFTVAVLADKNIRAERLVARDNINFEAVMKRIESQKSDKFYIDNSDYTLYNNGEIQELHNKIEEIVTKEGVYH